MFCPKCGTRHDDEFKGNCSGCGRGLGDIDVDGRPDGTSALEARWASQGGGLPASAGTRGVSEAPFERIQAVRRIVFGEDV